MRKNRFHFIEFMDLDWLPASLRDTQRDILELANGRPFRDYFEWLVGLVKERLRTSAARRVIELGAGSAPVTRRLVKEQLPDGVRLVVTDLKPDVDGYEALTREYPDRVFSALGPVDFSTERNWPPESILVLSTTFHHLHPNERRKVLENLVDSGAQVIIAEGLNRNFLSMFLAFFGGLGVALVAPLFQFSRPGRLRRLFWCWLLPIAPLVFSVDGVTSALRCWTKREWLSALEPLLPRLAAPPELRQSLCSLAAMFKGKSAEAAPVESTYCFFFRYGRSSKPASRSDRPDVEAPQTCTVCGHVGRAGLCPDRVS